MSSFCPGGELAEYRRRVEGGTRWLVKWVCAYVCNLLSRGGDWVAELARGMEDLAVRCYITENELLLLPNRHRLAKVDGVLLRLLAEC
jgi:hypothetical protein